MLAALRLPIVRALDQIKQDGRISQEEFYRLYEPSVLAAGLLRATLKPKVHAMWTSIAKDPSDGQVERLACWDIIFADKELAGIVGSSDAEKGVAMLQAMKDGKVMSISKPLTRIPPKTKTPLASLAPQCARSIRSRWTVASPRRNSTACTILLCSLPVWQGSLSSRKSLRCGLP